ncbi:hypothetical protein DFP72DRAFT_855976 [Ephemerocybe angulata]|uniref:Uncharacterized protein n=1 Tax=Ephemerocybe angulata TaxID=980116 RepID=A0A8H6LYI0_9AGAR|nr:hypothetical protein DFP72DRAFT_855976 [Tulosesus angulatus]
MKLETHRFAEWDERDVRQNLPPHVVLSPRYRRSVPPLDGSLQCFWTLCVDLANRVIFGWLNSGLGRVNVQWVECAFERLLCRSSNGWYGQWVGVSLPTPLQTNPNRRQVPQSHSALSPQKVQHNISGVVDLTALENEDLRRPKHTATLCTSPSSFFAHDADLDSSAPALTPRNAATAGSHYSRPVGPVTFGVCRHSASRPRRMHAPDIHTARLNSTQPGAPLFDPSRASVDPKNGVVSWCRAFIPDSQRATSDLGRRSVDFSLRVSASTRDVPSVSDLANEQRWVVMRISGEFTSNSPVVGLGAPSFRVWRVCNDGGSLDGNMPLAWRAVFGVCARVRCVSGGGRHARCVSVLAEGACGWACVWTWVEMESEQEPPSRRRWFDWACTIAVELRLDGDRGY